MTLRWSLLALVLLVLCGGVELVWAAMPAEVATECPVAPEAPVGRIDNFAWPKTTGATKKPDGGKAEENADAAPPILEPASKD